MSIQDQNELTACIRSLIFVLSNAELTKLTTSNAELTKVATSNAELTKVATSNAKITKVATFKCIQVIIKIG